MKNISQPKEKEKVVPTASTMQLQPTSDKDLFRYVDENGDWQFYFVKSLNRYFPAVNRILTRGLPKGEGFYKYLLSVTKDEAGKVLEAAGDRGSRVHQAIVTLISGMEIPRDMEFKSDLIGGGFGRLTNDEWKYVIAWQKWCAIYKPQVLFAEKSLFSEKVGAAGTIDFVGTIEYKGKRVFALLDWKTSSKLHEDYFLQVAAYNDMLPEKCPFTGVLRLKLGRLSTAEPFEFKLFDEKKTAEHAKMFGHAKVIHDFLTDAKNYNPEKDNEELPLVLKVDVPQYKPEKKVVGKKKKESQSNGKREKGGEAAGSSSKASARNKAGEGRS